MTRHWIAATPILLLFLGFAGGGEALIIRHDVNPEDYLVDPADYPALFFIERQGLERVCVATVIHPRWAITAAHCAEETLLAETVAVGRRYAVEVAGQSREIDLLITHPDYDQLSSSDVDLALLRFRQAATRPAPVPLYQSDAEQGAVVTLLGWGYFGRGTVGRQFADGRLRLAENRVERAGRRLRLVFDDPRLSAATLPLEGTPGLGDSGGPALLRSAQGWQIAGVAVGEVNTPDFTEETQGKYGAVSIYERLSRHLDWIITVIGSPPPYGS